jgi:signal transduction histidine kinase
LVYALLFSLVATIALGFAYWLATEQVRSQIDERLQLETNVLLSRYYSGTFDDLNRTINHRTNKDATHFFVYGLTHKDQHNFFDDLPSPPLSDRAVFATLPLNNIVNNPPKNNPELATRVLITSLADNYQLLVGMDLSEQENLLAHIEEVLLIAIFIIISSALLIGWWMGNSILKRIDKVHQTAKEIIEGDLSQRMPLQKREDEFNRLGKVVNDILDRLETLMISMQDVTNNLAHDLRNPLNRLKYRLKSIIDDVSTNKKQQQELGKAVADVDHLVSTFNAILNIAQIEAKVQRDHWEEVDISGMILELGDLYSLVAEEQELSFQLYCEKQLSICADRNLIAQAITNLLDNAIKFTPKGGRVHLKAYHKQSQLIISISDSGSGISKKEHKRIFQRFVRLETARHTSGNGLGLSLVKAIMDLHHAQINLFDNQPGLRVELIF